ncbi:MAG: hypothetical protein JSV33_05970 [bacterium]|nr:MAG: hypothetical protein JSV33_05970 [bacterium]
MRRSAVILFTISILLACALWQDDSKSEEKGRLVIDTMYARLTVGYIEERPCRSICTVCDLIIQYHFGTYPGSIPSILIKVLEGEIVCSVNRNIIGSTPIEMQKIDSIRTYFPDTYKGVDTAHVEVSLFGSFDDYVGEGDSRKKISYGTIEYIDTLFVPIQRIK